MSNEVYTDLENKISKDKHDSIRIKVIELLVDEYSDNNELGKAVRDYIKLEKTKEND